MADKFYIRRFPVWGGGWHYAVAERGRGKLASAMFRSRRACQTLLDRMEADWQRFAAGQGPMPRRPAAWGGRATNAGKRRKTPGVRHASL